MKKVIFLCFLSLSVCLSKPAENQAATPPPTGKPASNETTVPPTLTKANPAPAATVPVAPPAAAPVVPPAQTGNTTTKNDTGATPTTITTTPSPPIPQDDNTTQNKGVPPKADALPATANATTEKATTDKGDKGDEGKAKEGTAKTGSDGTPKPSEMPKPTAAPTSDKDAHITHAGGFSGASFIGGMVLTLGLLAIGFMGFKYYKNHTERNYHTL